MAIQFYTPSSDGPVSGFMEGRKFRQDEAYRKALEMLKAEEFAKKDLGGFQSAKYGPEGYLSGFEKNQANVDQAVKRYPEAYLRKEIPGTPAMPDPAVQEAKNASTERAKLAAMEEAKRMGTPFIEPDSPGAPSPVSTQAAPQMDYAKPITDALKPQPLLKSKEQLAPGQPVDESAARIPIGQTTPTGKPGESIAATHQRVSFGDAPVIGETAANKMLPAKPPVQDPTLPTLEQMAAIDRQRFSGQKDAITSVSMGEYPPAFRVALGFPADYTGTVNKDVLIKMIDNLKQKTSKQNEIIAPDIIDAVKSIESGVPLSEAADKLYETRGGAGFSPREMSVLQRAESIRTSKTNADRTAGMAADKIETEKKKLSPKNEDRIINLDTLKNTLEQARELVTSGKVEPRWELDALRRFGIYGGMPLEVANRIVGGLGGKPITNDELQFLKLTSNSNLSKLVEVAGTTFTARFGSMIQDLGADISDKNRFNQNVDQMLSEIDRNKNNIINVGQSNKSGKIAEQKPTVSHAPKEQAAQPSAAKMNASQIRIEREQAQKIIDKYKGDKKEEERVKATFKSRTGVDF